jgi:hypothetical protein
MTDETTEPIVLQDAEGAYYLLPRAVIDAYRIADEHRAEVEQALGGELSVFSLRTTRIPWRSTTSTRPNP